MSSVLAGFLVRLGFVVDKDQQAKFQASIDHAGKRMREITMRGAALGTAFTAAFAKSTQEVNRFYNLTNQVGGSVRGLNNVASAVAKVGGNYDQAVSSIQAFANRLTFTPGMEQAIKNLTQIDLRDQNGQMREYSDILLDLRKRWETMEDAVAKNEAAMMGLDGIYADIMKRDFAGELAKTNRQQGELADLVDQSADSVHRLSNEFSRTWEIATMGAKAAFSAITDSLGLDKWLAKLNDTFANELPALLKTEKRIWDESDGAADYLKNFFFKAGEFHDADRYDRGLMDDTQAQAYLTKRFTKKRVVQNDEFEDGVEVLDDLDRPAFEAELARYRQLRVSKGYAPADSVKNAAVIEPKIKEPKAIEAKVIEPKAIEPKVIEPKAIEAKVIEPKAIEAKVIEPKAIEPKVIEPKAIEPKVIEPKAIEAKVIEPKVPTKLTRGLRNNNPGNMRPVSKAQANDGAFTIFPNREAGWGALGKQLKGYANAGLENVASIISKFAPASENNTQAYINAVVSSMSKRLGADVSSHSRLDLSDARVLKALMQSITEHENFKGAAQYFEGPSFDKEVLAASQSQWKSKVVNERDKMPSRGQVVVNQNITINGSDRPEAVGRAVAQETLLAQNRYGQRNLS